MMKKIDIDEMSNSFGYQKKGNLFKIIDEECFFHERQAGALSNYLSSKILTESEKEKIRKRKKKNENRHCS